MGRSVRTCKIDDQVVSRIGRLIGPQINGPPYDFQIRIHKDDVDKVVKGGRLVTFEEWGTSCCDCWKWYQHPLLVCKRVIFQKYEHDLDEDSVYGTAFFAADEIWQFDNGLMEEIPHEPNQPWPAMGTLSPTLNPKNIQKMAWAIEKVWKWEDGDWKEKAKELL